MAKSTQKQQETPREEPHFTPLKLIESKRFARYRDIISGTFDPLKTYTIAETEEKINQFLKGGA